MPATLILLPALLIGLAAWIAAWLNTRHSAHITPGAELQRMRNHAAWLEQRLDTARRERWDHAMIVSLSDELGHACSALAQAQARARTEVRQVSDLSR